MFSTIPWKENNEKTLEQRTPLIPSENHRQLRVKANKDVESFGADSQGVGSAVLQGVPEKSRQDSWWDEAAGDARGRGARKMWLQQSR